MDTVCVETPAGLNVNLKKGKKRRRRKGKTKANDGCVAQSMDQKDENVHDFKSGKNGMVVKACLQVNLLQLDADAKLSQENPLTSMDPTANPMEKLTKSQKRRWRKARTKALSKLGPESMDHASIISNLSMVDASDASAGGKINNETDMSQESTGKGSAVSLSGPLANLEQKGVELVKNHTRTSPSLFKISSHNICHQFSQERVEAQNYLLAVPYQIPHRRKLLILDVNGLLADIVRPPPRGCKPDINIYRHAIFKRPFYLDFLKFCFERFDVGIWSSRKRQKLYRMVDYLCGDLKHKFVFVWDARFCTKSRFYSPENRKKPIVFKELQKLWGKHDPNLPWEKGDYDESNTLLLDDSPYKALLNPMHTGVFPFSYSYKAAEGDNSLGLGGDVRVYLEGLAVAESVQHYVAHHPFGQSAINETNPCWNFYSEVLQSFLIQSHERV